MKFGKIRVENGNLLHVRHMLNNSLPCEDIVWAYIHREDQDMGSRKKITITYLSVHTRRNKHYNFDMTESEARECLRLLRALNPSMAVGFPKGHNLHLESARNIRDLGGIRTIDGRLILPGRLLCGECLYHISQNDQFSLKENYHLSSVIDFRTAAEKNRRMDTIISGVKYYQLPIFDEETKIFEKEGNILDICAVDAAELEDRYTRQYENAVREPFAVKQLARFMDTLISQDNGALLWHCSRGKDRAALATALLLKILDVPDEAIFEDYKMNNIYLEEDMGWAVRYLENRMIVSNQILSTLRTVFTVKESYLRTAFRTIDYTYGSMERFIRKGLYMSPKNIEDLRNKYLV